MGWNFLGIFYVISLVVCLVGFYKYVYFLSIGYGFAVSGIGVAMAVMMLTGALPASLPMFIYCALYLIYGIRLSGFLLIREIKNASYRKTLKEATGEESAMPIFVKVAIWIFTSILYVAQTSPVFFRAYNGKETTALIWVGIAISIFGICLEALADQQKTEQKKAEPNKVAMKGLYKRSFILDRCICSFFGCIKFSWTVGNGNYRLHLYRVYHVQWCAASGKTSDGTLR